MAVQHEAIPTAMVIHHSLKHQTSAPSALTLVNPMHVTAPTRQTSSRLRRPSSSRAETETGTIHVLLVEDNEISQKLLKKQLVRAGCSVITANDGVEALEILLKNASTSHPGSLVGTGHRNAKIELILMGV